MNNLIFLSFLLSFILSIILFIFWIPILRKLKLGQYIRLDGPQDHLKKSGTPTMGGLVMIVVIISIFIFFELYFLKDSFYNILFYILPLMLYGVIGLIDDLLIINKHNNKGISPKAKIILQCLSILIYYLIYYEKFNSIINLGIIKIDLKTFYFFFILLIFVSCTNAVNLTDGLDGLAGGTLVICFLGISILGYFKSNTSVSILSTICIGSLLGFLLFNHYPAKIFMGNTGSLMFGSLLALQMVALDEEMLLLIMASVFIIETLSVIIQVIYFKITNGKRFFKMAPLHHHFEKNGLSEWKIDLVFWLMALVSVVFMIIVLLM